jgi:hypothetical protein
MIPENTQRFVVMGCITSSQEHLRDKSSTGCNTTKTKVRDETYKGLQIPEEDK